VAEETTPLPKRNKEKRKREDEAVGANGERGKQVTGVKPGARLALVDRVAANSSLTAKA
jgi:hypothetical protein